MSKSRIHNVMDRLYFYLCQEGESVETTLELNYFTCNQIYKSDLLEQVNSFILRYMVKIDH